jgi:hypothetical protein
MERDRRRFMEDIPAEEELDDARILDLVQYPQADLQDPSDAEVDDEPKISFSEAKIHFNKCIKFLGQQPVEFSKDIWHQVLRDMLSSTHRASLSAKKQSTLDNFFIK